MLDPSRDARVAEISLLAKLERAEKQMLWYRAADRVERQLLLHLVHEGYVNGRETLDQPFDEPPEGVIDHRVEDTYVLSMQRVERGILADREVLLVLGHKGRLRLAELEQDLSSARDRDPTGTFVSRRYFDRDLAVAITRCSPEQVVCLAIVDMNGLKSINDTHGHNAGDAAIRGYLTTVAEALPQGATGYRGDGGDEVFVIARGVALPDFVDCITTALTALSHVVVVGQPLSAACGVRVTSNAGQTPAEFLRLTDDAQYRAKAASRIGTTRRSTLAVNDEGLKII